MIKCYYNLEKITSLQYNLVKGCDILKKCLIFVLIICLMNLNFIVYAHDSLLEVNYDSCIPDNEDGVDEAWYYIDDGYTSNHLDHQIDTIEYYFEDFSLDGTYSWTTNISETLSKEIKDAYENSMKKWNNVYFYSYDNNGYIVKNKIINIVEGTKEKHNLTIYPEDYTIDFMAATYVSGDENRIQTNPIYHRHYSEYFMKVCDYYFYPHGSYSETITSRVRDFVGAHEVGHILGLRDIDNCCDQSNSRHHEELLMGYGTESSQNITYKDIAGVAITRGYHTDDDHMWLYDASRSSVNNFKLICSICNGVKYVEDLSGYSYQAYYSCQSNHNLSSGNMMVVASYGTKDYYKCKYCRWVAPFTSNVEQNYSYNEYSKDKHLVTNQVEGIEYSFFQNHDLSRHDCLLCFEEHTHIYKYEYVNSFAHILKCLCGETTGGNVPHAISSSDVGKDYAVCIGCGKLLNFNSDIGTGPGIQNINVKSSNNGSYILSNGIIVLVDDDIESYLNNTLVWNNANVSDSI